jgi:hypothetical protein
LLERDWKQSIASQSTPAIWRNSSPQSTLLEEVQIDSSLITLRPVQGKPAGLFATSVCFDDANTCDGELRVVGLEFASYQTLAGISPINNSDRGVLKLICGVLRSYRKIARFGIRLLHDPLRLKEAVLLETCDPVRRVLTCRSCKEDDPALAQSIATMFRWEEARARDEDGLVIGQECIQVCKSVHRCNVSVHGSHNRSSSHEPSGHKSF